MCPSMFGRVDYCDSPLTMGDSMKYNRKWRLDQYGKRKMTESKTKKQTEKEGTKRKKRKKG